MGPAFGCAGARQRDAKEKEAAAGEGCGNPELCICLRPQQPVFTQRQTAGLWSQTAEDGSGSGFCQCRVASSWDSSSSSLKATS